MPRNTLLGALLSATLVSVTLLAGVASAPLCVAAEPDPIKAAVADPNRTAEDRARDERDHAVAVLTFFGIKPGMVVADVFAAGGYYSELIGRVVAPKGKVYLYNNAGFAKFAEKPLAARVASGRMNNVTVIEKEVGEIGIPQGRWTWC